jgi:hypothetical protein
MWDMLATKVADRDYLRNRRTHLINALKSDYRSLEYLVDYLRKKGISETASTILDDIKSFENIGLTIVERHGEFKITDEIVGLQIPDEIKILPNLILLL